MVTRTTNKTVQGNPLRLIKNDPYLAPYEEAIRGRHEHALWKIKQLTKNGKTTFSDFANGYK